MAQVSLHDGLVTIATDSGEVLLEGWSTMLQLADGRSFPMAAMVRTADMQPDEGVVTISSGGGATLPAMVLRIETIGAAQIQAELTITNTTPDALPIERLSVLTCDEGYLRTPLDQLTVRRTGWQTFSPASLATPAPYIDPWLQPPLYAPDRALNATGYQPLSWMTVLRTADRHPLLIGFGGAKNYLGTIDVQPGTFGSGHRLAAHNHLEGVALEPGASITSEPLLLSWGPDEQTLLGWYGDFVGAFMDARVPSHTPTGWSHWLYYFAQVTEQDIVENMRIIADRDLPFEYIQVDDGYQTAFGDWLSINDKFPHGMQWLAEQIKATGRKPGIWLSPFMAYSTSQIVTEHPDWFLHDDAGRLINVNRHGDPYWAVPNYGLDITHPDAYAWLENVITTMCQTWGYEYIKADFLYAGAIRAKRYDQTVTSVQAYRRGMALIRRIAGDRLVLGCGAPLLCSVGFVDDMRIGPDLSWEFDSPGVIAPPDATLPHSREPLLSLFSHQWMNRRLWVNDADYLRVRQHNINLDWPQTVALSALIALGGGALYNSDKLATLEPAGFDFMKRLYPAATSNALPVSTGAGRPEYLLEQTVRGDGRWYIAARFNWAEQPLDLATAPEDWHIPSGEYHVYDLLGERYLGINPTSTVAVEARGAGLCSLCPVAKQPQVIATKGHLLGPAGDIQRTGWQHNELRIELASGRQLATQLLVTVPDGYAIESIEGCTASAVSDGIVTITPHTDHCAISFRTPSA